MTMTADETLDQPALVGIPQIAEIAGVGRSAVGNWRKRHPDFPAPTVQTPSGALFDLNEVEHWLIDQGKIERRVPASARLWSVAHAAREVWRPEEFVRFSVAFLVYLEACARARGEGAARNVPRPDIPPGTDWSDLRTQSADRFLRAFTHAAQSIESANPDVAGLLDPGLQGRGSHDASQLAYHVALTLDEATDEDTTRYRLFEGLEDLEAADAYTGEFATPRDLASLVAGVVEARGGTILDLAVGEGRLLMQTACPDGQRQGNVRAVGVDKNLDACRRSRSRFYLYGREADIRHEDSLRSHPDALPMADTIVLDPPYGIGNWGTVELYVDPRWQFGPAPPNSADFAWLQLAVTHLQPNGRAAVLMGTASLTKGGREGAIRERMVAAGVIEGIVLLPPRLRTNTSISLVLWLLRSAASPERHADLLLVDASDLGEPGRSRYSLPEHNVQRLVSLVRRWRADDTISPSDARFAVAVSRDEILSTGAILLPARYQLPPDIDVERLRAEAQSVRASLTQSSAAANSANAELLRRPPSQPQRSPRMTDRRRLGDLVQTLRGQVPANTVEDPDGQPFFGLAEITARGTGAPRYVDADVDVRDPVILREGDVVVALMSNIGAAAVIDADAAGSVLGRECVALRITARNELSPRWLAAWMESEEARFQISQHTGGSTMPRLPVKALETFTVTVPPGPVQGEIDHLVGRLDSAISTTATTLQQLQRLRAIEIQLAMATQQERRR